MKILWWLWNYGRISEAVQREAEIGLVHCQVFHLSDYAGRQRQLRLVRRHRRNLDRLRQLRRGKSPWDTAHCPGWEKRDQSFRLMSFAMDE